MFIRYNEVQKYYEYDTSAGQTGAGPWVILPISSLAITGPGGTPTNVAYTNRVNQFEMNQRISNALGDYPRLTLKNVNLGVDQKTWQILLLDQNLSFWALNDAENTVIAQFAIDRTGTLVSGLVPSARLSANVALIDRQNLFSQAQSINAALTLYGHILWYGTTAPADARIWHDLVDASGNRSIYPVNDAQNTVQGGGFNFGRNSVLSVGAGVKFPSSQISISDVNTFDDYEEGTFLPGLFSSDGGRGIPTTATGRYVKIGQFVHCQYDYVMNGASWPSGYLYLDGFPYQPINDNVVSSGATTLFGGLAVPLITVTLHMYSGTAYGHFNYKDKASLANDGALIASYVAPAFTITGAVSYRTPT